MRAHHRGNACGYRRRKRLKRPFFERINAMLPKYATGGLVGNINPGRISADFQRSPVSSGTPIVLNWPDGTSSRMSAEGAVAEEIVRVFQRASLQRGRRK